MPPNITPEIRSLLDALRARIRRYVWMEGAAATLAWLAAAFWGSLALDRFFEPPWQVRATLLAVVAITTGWIAHRYIVSRLFVPLTDRSMALLLERYFPRFNEALLTSVELSEGENAEGESHRASMLEQTRLLAQQAVDRVDLRDVFNRMPLWWTTGSAVVLLAAIGLFALLLPSAMGVWSRRNLLMSGELWPRRTRLIVDGFEDGRIKVARGSDLTVLVKADLSMPLVPDTVDIRYRSGGGPRRDVPMSRDGTADPEVNRFQEFSYTFNSLLAPMTFDVVGGDAAVRGLEVEIVASPAVIDAQIECRYPAYMDRSSRRIRVTGPMQIPARTEITLHAEANKPLASVEVEVRRDRASEKLSSKSNRLDSEDPSRFSVLLGRLDTDLSILVTLHDTDGITSRTQARVVLGAMPDLPPELAVQLNGIGQAITPNARLPVQGRVTDDHGIARIWFQHGLTDADPTDTPISAPKGNPTDTPLNATLEAGPLGLEPGEKLVVSTKAADYLDGKKGPNIGTSDRWLLDVVTGDQLRLRLETRELILRQRFEAIIDEVVRTHDALVRLEFQPPGDDATDPPDPADLLARRKLDIERAMQDGQKQSHEILSVAEAFEDLRQQLLNNRIDTPQGDRRLAEGIVAPLHQAVQRAYPELDHRLDRLFASAADTDDGPAHRDRSVQQIDEILTLLRGVLSRMIELEDLREAIELLREIIDGQERLRLETDQQHKDNLRKALGEALRD